MAHDIGSLSSPILGVPTRFAAIEFVLLALVGVSLPVAVISAEITLVVLAVKFVLTPTLAIVAIPARKARISLWVISLW